MKHNNTGLLEKHEGNLEILQSLLTDLTDLRGILKQAHWNLQGPTFIAVHKLFDSEASDILDLADTVAERIAVLGGRPKGFAKFVADNSQLQTPDDITEVNEWIHFVLGQYQSVSKYIYDNSSKVGEIDPASEDLMIEVVRRVDLGIYYIAGHDVEA